MTMSAMMPGVMPPGALLEPLAMFASPSAYSARDQTMHNAAPPVITYRLAASAVVLQQRRAERLQAVDQRARVQETRWLRRHAVVRASVGIV
jgi:hypothetical protein